MNILFLTYQGDLAGSTTSIASLSQGLAARGHGIFVGCRQESLLAELLKDSVVHLIPMTFRGKFDPANIWQIKRIVQHDAIDIINAQSSYDRYTSILAKWLQRLKVKVVHTRRQIPRSAGGFLQNTFYVKGTDRIVAVSSGVKDALVKLGIPASHIVVIPNGISFDKYDRHFDDNLTETLKRQYHISVRDIVIGCIARKKKQEQLLQALQFVSIRTTVLFIGIEPDESYQKFLEPIRDRHRVIFCGTVDPSFVLDYYKLFTLHVLPSTIEGLSQTLLEAMAFRVPVIATRAGGNTDIIKDGENGFLFEDDNLRQLAQKITQIATMSEAARNSMLESAWRTVIEEYSIQNTILAYEQFFKRLLREKDTCAQMGSELLGG